MTTWYDRVIAKLETIREQYEADDRAFNELYSYLNDARANRDGEQLTRNGKIGIKSYQEREVFSFFVKDGQLIVNSRLTEHVGGEDESKSFTEREQALDRMSDLMARVVYASG